MKETSSDLRMKETIEKKKAKEGKNLFGSPTFIDLGNGRLRCDETGQEVLAGEEGSYTRNKRCRLGLIDYALSQGKSPLNMFSQVIVFNFLLVISERREKALTTVNNGCP